MSRLSRWCRISLAASISAWAFAAMPQSDDPLGSYLSDRELDDVYAEYLAARLEREAGEARVKTAQELAEVYIRLLDASSNSAGRQQWATRASSLLRLVPEADSPELNINLAKAAYLRAESIAERFRLRLTDEREAADAERTLRDIGPRLVSLGQDAHRRSEMLEGQLGRKLDREDEDRVTEQLTEARRQRSFAFYFAGWSSYYLSLLTNDPAFAEQSLRHFGWLLNAGTGEPASVEGLQDGLLRFEHVARSAIGAGLASSRTGRIVEANAWLDSVARNSEVDPAIRSQIPARKAAVYATGSMWRDLDTLARRSLSPEAGDADPLFARLIAVLALDELAADGNGRSSELLRRLADEAFSTLIAAGEIAHVADLARVYGPDRIRGTGFVPAYVRGLLALDTARASAPDQDASATDPLLKARYLEAGEMLAQASEAPDADAYPNERELARLDAGLAFHRGGQAEQAAAILDLVWSGASDPETRERALWLSVVALDESVEGGREDLSERRDRAAIIYMTTYPISERASLLAMRPGTAGLLTEEQAVDILLSTPSGSPSYAEARRRASGLLYRAYRSARAEQATLAAQRYMTLAEELITADRAALRELGAQPGRVLAESILIRCRRLADAAMGVSPPSVERARFALDTIDRVASYAAIDLADTQAELDFRRLQIASAEGDTAASDRAMARLREAGGSYRAAASRLLYRDAVRAWIDRQSDPLLARRVVEMGNAVHADLVASTAGIAVRIGVLDTVSQAAFAWWQAGGNEEAVRNGLAAGRAIEDLGGGDLLLVTRQAKLLAVSGDRAEALEAWRRVLAAAPQGSQAWFEARYESLSLLADIDLPLAKAAAQQFVALHPNFGPPASRESFRRLIDRIEAGGGP